MVAESGAVLDFEPTVLFEGQVDSATPEAVAADVLATLREGLSNVARHAQASKADVEIAVNVGGNGELLLRITDDGIGPPAADQPRGNGLDNMAARAVKRGGSFEIAPCSPSGTQITWRVPIK